MPKASTDCKTLLKWLECKLIKDFSRFLLSIGHWKSDMKNNIQYCVILRRLN